MKTVMINKTFSSYEEREKWLKEYDEECRANGSAILMVKNAPQYAGVPESYTIESIMLI